MRKARPHISFKATTISPEVAEILVKHEGILFLSSLKELDSETARILSKHKNEVSLSGLKTVTPEVMAITKSSGGRMRLSKRVKVLDSN